MEKSDSTEINPFGRDALARFLFSGEWHRLLLAEATFLILAAAPVVAAITFGLFKNSTLKLDVQGDIGYWNHILAGSGLILAMGVWQERLVQVVKELRQLGVVAASPVLTPSSLSIATEPMATTWYVGSHTFSLYW